MCIATPRGHDKQPVRLTVSGVLWALFIAFAAGVVWLLAHRPWRRRAA